MSLPEAIACVAPPCTANEAAEDEGSIESRNIQVDFGRVEIFQERTRRVAFMRPMTDDVISYRITRNCNIKTIKTNFELDHRQGELRPGQNFKLTVAYKPTMSSVRDMEVFDYADSDNERIKITVMGVAVGPRCFLSTKRVVFNGKAERKVELRNDSSATARFRVDHPEGDVFQVQPLEGAVPPNSYRYLTVRFRPPRPGLFARRIFCLVWNCVLLQDFYGLPMYPLTLLQEPLLLHVVGKNGAGEGWTDMAFEQLNGFQAYLRAGQVTLDPACLDFGHAQTPRPLHTTIVNRLPSVIRVDWRQVQSGRVSVAPPLVEVPPNGSQAFEVRMRLGSTDYIAQETQLAQVDGPVALTCALRVQAHSFPLGQGWISHVEIMPDVVCYQPCAPGEVAHTTFLMRNRSHLPVLFRLEPTSFSKITAKPMMGLCRHTEIVAVQLHTDEGVAKTYMEAWRVVLNGCDDRPIPLWFRGESCLPQMEIGRRNRIDVGPVQDGSQKEVEVMMKNTSYYAISYQFQLGKKSMVEMAPMAGVLPANETTGLLVKVTGSQCAPSRERLCCQMRIVDAYGAVSGNSYDLPVDVFSECSYSQLCACPDSWDFGRVAFGQRIKCEFQAVNFGASIVFFQACQTGEEALDNSFRIKPCFGEMKPRDGRCFSVGGIASQVGGHTLHFGYYNRMVKDSPLVTGAPITLFTLSYEAEFPIVQVEEIVEHNFGQLFGKAAMSAHFLDMPRLNQALRLLESGHSLEHRSRLPEFALQPQEFWVRLALSNVSDFDCDVALKRHQMCTCTEQEAESGLSRRKRVFGCHHLAVLAIGPAEVTLPARTSQLLSINVRYTLPGATSMAYVLSLSHNRTLFWHFDVYAIAPGVPRLSTYMPAFNLELPPAHLGDPEPPLGCFWLYNNTGRELAFETGKTAHRAVFQLLNPLDQILPGHCKPLLIKFQPVEAKRYSADLQLRYYFPEVPQGALSATFVLTGEGVLNAASPPRALDCVRTSGKFTGNFPATLSVERLELRPLPTWSCHKELIFLKSVSRGKIVQYTWSEVCIEGVLEVRVETPFGILYPKEVHPVVVVVKALATPCTTTVVLPCELVEYSDRLLHQMTQERHLEAERRIAEFMEGELSSKKRPKNPIRVVPEPPILFSSVTIAVATQHQYPAVTSPPLEGSLFCRVLEEAISQVVFSDELRSLLQEALRAPMRLYSEFCTPSEGARRQEVEQFIDLPNRATLSALLQGLIYEGVLTLAQCPQPSFDLRAVEYSVERSLFNCRKPNCSCGLSKAS